MSEITLKCQGLACPGPVLQCKKTVESVRPEIIVVHVDNDAARQNVTRFLSMNGYEAESRIEGAEFVVNGRLKDAPKVEECPVMTESQLAGQKVCVFITSPVIGSGDDVLGGKLMLNFLGTLPELGEDLWRIVLVNGAVKLAVEGSPVLDKLQALAANGVSILVCGTCLDFFGVLDKKRVGETTNMLDVVTSLQLADKVIKI